MIIIINDDNDYTLCIYTVLLCRLGIQMFILFSIKQRKFSENLSRSTRFFTSELKRIGSLFMFDIFVPEYKCRQFPLCV